MCKSSALFWKSKRVEVTFYGLFGLSAMVHILCSCSKVKVQRYLTYSFTCLVVSHLMISHQNHSLILVSTHQVNCFLIYVTIKENIHKLFFFSYYYSHTNKCNKSQTDWGQRFKYCYGYLSITPQLILL